MRRALGLDLPILAILLALGQLLPVDQTQGATEPQSAPAQGADSGAADAFQAGRAGADRRTHRAVPGRLAGAGLHGLDLSARDRAGRALVQGASGRQGRRGREGDGEADLGSRP